MLQEQKLESGEIKSQDANLINQVSENKDTIID